MANLFKLELGKFNALTGKLAEAGLTAELGDAILKDPSLARVGVAAIEAALAEAAAKTALPRFHLAVEEQLKRFSEANAAGGWGFGPEVVERLAASAPEWPEGALCVRSLKIRIGEGTKGVYQTFEDHAAEMKRVHGAERYWRWEHLHSAPTPYAGTDKELRMRFGEKPIERLRLLAGNETHVPTVEWVTLDLGANRQRTSVEAVRNATSPADEILVIGWLFPEYVRAIDGNEVPALFAPGYEANVPGGGGLGWQGVPLVSLYGRRASLYADWLSRDCPGASVPVPRE